MNINTQRIYKIAHLFYQLGMKGVEIFEEIDPQYQVIKQVLKYCDSKIVTLAFYFNSLIAYRLKMMSEEFWKIFALFLIQQCKDIEELNDLIELIKVFTQKFNKYLYKQKIKRLERLKQCKDILTTIDKGDYLLLAKKTANCLRSSVEAKTVVFSTKIVYYVLKAQNINTTLPFELPIPVDKRVTFVSYMSGLIEIPTHYINVAVGLLLRNANIVREAWKRISILSRIPSLHIDAVLWYFGKFYKVKSVEEVVMNVDDVLYQALGKKVVESLVRELFYRLSES